MRLLIIIFLALFCFLQYNLWFDKAGILQTLRLKNSIVSQKEANQVLIKRNQILTENVRALKKEQGSVEQLAREKLNMVKPGETYYRILEN